MEKKSLLIIGGTGFFGRSILDYIDKSFSLKNLAAQCSLGFFISFLFDIPLVLVNLLQKKQRIPDEYESNMHMNDEFS